MSTRVEATTKKILKASNISVIGDGLSTSSVNPQLFADLGKSKSFIQVPQMSYLDFGKYSLLVQPEERRAVVADVTGELNVNSPIPAMLKTFLQESKGLSIAAIGFNFIYDVVLERPTAEFLLREF